MSSTCSGWPELDSLNGVRFSWADRQGQEGSGRWGCRFGGHQLKEREEDKVVGKVLRWDVGDTGLLLNLGRLLLHLGRIRKGVFAFPCAVKGEQDVLLVESAKTWW